MNPQQMNILRFQTHETQPSSRGSQSNLLIGNISLQSEKKHVECGWIHTVDSPLETVSETRWMLKDASHWMTSKYATEADDESSKIDVSTRKYSDMRSVESARSEGVSMQSLMWAPRLAPLVAIQAWTRRVWAQSNSRVLLLIPSGRLSRPCTVRQLCSSSSVHILRAIIYIFVLALNLLPLNS